MQKANITAEQYRALLALSWFPRDGEAITVISPEEELQLGLNFPIGVSKLHILEG